MVKITKNEAKELHKMGVKYGEGGISHTTTSNPHYYLCTKNLPLLNKIRNSKVVR